MAYSLSLSVSQSHGPGANQSTVTAILYLRGYNGYPWGNYAYWGYSTSYSITIGGNGTGGRSGPRSLNTDQWGNVNSTDSTVEVGRHSVTFNHDGNGYRGDIYASAGFDGDGGYSPGHMDASGSAGALNYDRRAYTPVTPTLSRGDSGTDIRMYTNNPGAGYGNSVDYYHWYYSTNGSTFNYLAQEGADWTWTTANPTQKYWIRVYAHAPDDNNGGWSDVSGTAVIDGAPLAPSKPAVSSTSTSELSIVSQGLNGNGLGLTSYQYRYAEFGTSSWTEVTNTAASAWTFTVPDKSKSYIFSTRTYNSSGWSAWSDSQHGIPGKPASVTTNTPVGLKATVYSGVSPGTEITQYYVSASKNNGVSWESEIPMGLDREYQYVGLSGGKDYLFRVRSQNSIGFSEYTILPATVFVPAGGKRWTGTEFVPTAIVKRKTDTGWETVTIAKRWTGTGWEVLT